MWNDFHREFGEDQGDTFVTHDLISNLCALTTSPSPHGDDWQVRSASLLPGPPVPSRHQPDVRTQLTPEMSGFQGQPPACYCNSPCRLVRLRLWPHFTLRCRSNRQLLDLTARESIWLHIIIHEGCREPLIPALTLIEGRKTHCTLHHCHAVISVKPDRLKHLIYCTNSEDLLHQSARRDLWCALQTQHKLTHFIRTDDKKYK